MTVLRESISGSRGARSARSFRLSGLRIRVLRRGWAWISQQWAIWVPPAAVPPRPHPPRFLIVPQRERAAPLRICGNNGRFFLRRSRILAGRHFQHGQRSVAHIRSGIDMKSESVRGHTDFAPELSRGEVGYTYHGSPTRYGAHRAPCGGCLKDGSVDFNQEWLMKPWCWSKLRGCMLSRRAARAAPHSSAAWVGQAGHTFRELFGQHVGATWGHWTPSDAF